MSERNKLFLLDAMALIYRAHFAFINNPRISSTGVNTSAVFGFTNTLLEIIDKEKPTHLAVVTDVGSKTFRNDFFPEYKAGRQETPEDIKAAIPMIKRLLEAMQIPFIGLENWEADDLIGTLAKKAQSEGFDVYMMTPDKDYAQLVDAHIFHYKPARPPKTAEIFGIEETLKHWTIRRIDQVIDILGLMGDKVDNIPGIPGVGEKSAIKLVREFGSVENLLENVDKLTGKLRERVMENKEMAVMSKRLATIDIHAPIEFDGESYRISDFRNEEVKQVLADLEFRTLGQKLFPGNFVINVSQAKPKPQSEQTDLFSLFDTPASETSESTMQVFSKENVVYSLVRTKEECLDLCQILQKAKEFAFDTETSGLDPFTSELVGMSFSMKPGEAYYVAVNESEADWQEKLMLFAPILQNPNKLLIGQNVKFDYQMMKAKGIEMQGPVYDTMLSHYIIDPDSRHNMDYLSEVYLGYHPISIETLIGKKGAKQGSMKDLAPELIRDYACEDADVTLQLRDALNPLLTEKNGEELLKNIEAPLVFVLGDMELEGITVDKDFLKAYSKEMEKDMAVIQEKVFELAGEEFNLNSPKQLGDILFGKLKLDPKAKKTKTGQYKTDEETLSALSNEHAIIGEMLGFRSLQKLKSTYVDALPTMINPITGRVHSNFQQAVAATGRLSSNNPNLQNIPIRTEQGREIRKAFIPRNEDFQIFSADYSQVELRLIAAISNDESMIEDFRNGHDIHTATASRVYGVPFDQVDSDLRRKAKTTNFGIIYGISAFGLSQRLGIKRTEAKEIIDQYFAKYSGIKTYMEEVVRKAREQGFVETIMGRRRYLRDINSANQTLRSFAERNAVNAPIQGSAADLIKIAMINIHNEMKKRNLKSKMILQVHDELLFDAHIDEKEELKDLVETRMSGAMSLSVPLSVEGGFGNNWLEAH